MYKSRIQKDYKRRLQQNHTTQQYNMHFVLKINILQFAIHIFPYHALHYKISIFNIVHNMQRRRVSYNK